MVNPALAFNQNPVWIVIHNSQHHTTNAAKLDWCHLQKLPAEKEMKLSLDTVPSTVKEAVDMIVAGLEPKEERFIAESPGSAGIHHTVGQAIRNNWSLWEPDSPLKRDAAENYGIAHADDISGLILEWVWATVWEIELDPLEFVKTYHEHWEDFGTTALEAGGWPPKDAE